MGMYSLIEDANNKRLAELVASGMTEDEAAETLHDEQEERLPYVDPATFPEGGDPR